MTQTPVIAQERDAYNRVRLELSNRHVLVLIHGLLLFEVGIVMILTGAPDFSSLWMGDHARLYMGIGAAIPGAILILGSFWRDMTIKGYALQVIGFAGVILWHATMAGLYTTYAYRQGVPLLDFGEPAPVGSARLYIPLVYTNILALASVQLITLLRLGRPPR